MLANKTSSRSKLNFSRPKISLFKKPSLSVSRSRRKLVPSRVTKILTSIFKAKERIVAELEKERDIPVRIVLKEAPKERQRKRLEE